MLQTLTGLRFGVRSAFAQEVSPIFKSVRSRGDEKTGQGLGSFLEDKYDSVFTDTGRCRTPTKICVEDSCTDVGAL